MMEDQFIENPPQPLMETKEYKVFNTILNFIFWIIIISIIVCKILI